MAQYSLWRYIVFCVIIVVAAIYALPNLYGEDPAIQISTEDAESATALQTDQISDLLQKHGVTYQAITPQSTGMLIRFSDTDNQLKAQDLIQKTLNDRYSIAPNLAVRTPRWLQWLGARPMKLGLDLRGGIHFLLAVDEQAILKNQLVGDLSTITTQLQAANIHYRSVQLNDTEDRVSIAFSDDSSREKAMSLLSQKMPDYHLEPRGDSLVGTLTDEVKRTLKQNAVDQVTLILRTRVNELGVGEPAIQQQGVSNISVDLPGIQDSARAKEIIGTVATIRLQLQDLEHDPVAAQKTGIVPLGSTLYIYEGHPVLLHNQVILRGTAILNAFSTLSEDGLPTVGIRIGGSQVSTFNRITAENIGKPLAVVYVENKPVRRMIRGKMVVSHVPQERIISLANIESALSNNFQITHLPSALYAKNLALLLRSGAYPVSVDFVEERIIGPSLGKENIKLGVWSTVIGSVLVFCFMAFYYRLFGLVADTALLLNIIFVISLLSILGATLTLPGIAGIVLTVGMAVDANVLINERIREELRLGMSPYASIKAGYERAFATIVDANVTTLIVMVVLFSLGSGPVQGFAVTTMIGLLCSMLTAIFFTRLLIHLIYSRRGHKQLSIGIRLPIASVVKQNHGIF